MAAEQIEALKGLLERVKAAEGADRELDADLAIVLEMYPVGAMHMSAFVDPATFATGAYSSWIAPAWTRSLDQALALAAQLLPKWSMQIGLSEGYRHPVVTMGRSYPTNKRVAVEHHTAPLALCQAIVEADLLEALAAKSAPPLTRSENDGGRRAP